MQIKEKKIWFPAKKYGWGWGIPCAWQGWVVIVSYLVILNGSAFLLLPAHPAMWFGCVAISTIILVAICLVKGETPRWRWGGD
jgi:hypothetical protein